MVDDRKQSLKVMSDNSNGNFQLLFPVQRYRQDKIAEGICFTKKH